MATAVEIPCPFIPSIKRNSIHETLKHVGATPLSKTCDGYRLARNSAYVIEVEQSLQLPAAFFGRANPKSSTGRSCMHARLLADFVSQYDRIPFGYQGKLYVMVCTNEFDVVFQDEYVAFNQLRLFANDMAILSTDELRALALEKKFLRNDLKNKNLIFSDHVINRNQAALSLDLKDWGEEDCLGYVARQDTTKPLVWTKGANEITDFFERIPKVSDYRAYRLMRDRFYILSSRESVYIPREYACEMVAFDDTYGELRTHYAGFIDNGWGEKGPRPLTLEVRPFSTNLVYHGQIITSIVLHRMLMPVEKSYDELSTSNYTDQKTARLGKFFKQTT